MTLTKKQAVDRLVELGLAERVISDPEGGFWGAQSQIETRSNRVELFRCVRRTDECGPGEVIPLHRISLDGEILWED